MTRDEAKQWIPILQAYADGKVIEVQDERQPNVWIDLVEPTFGYLPSRYRIKPSPTYRPWTEAEIEAECIKGTVIKSQTVLRIGPMVRDMDGVYIGKTRVCYEDLGGFLFENYVIATTGEPCGVLEEA